MICSKPLYTTRCKLGVPGGCLLALKQTRVPQDQDRRVVLGCDCFGVIQDIRRSKTNTDSGIVDPPFLNEAENETLVRHDLKVDFPRISEVAKIVIFTA